MGNFFDSIMADDLAFVNSGEFSEPITLTRSTGQQIALSAAINRFTVDPVSGTQGNQAFTPHAEFWIPSTLLNSPPEKNGDSFSYPTRQGDAPSAHGLHSIVRQDAAGWLVRCR